MKLLTGISGFRRAASGITLALCITTAFAVPPALGGAAMSTGRSLNAEVGGLFIPISRSELVIVPHDIDQVLLADPSITDVHVIGSRRLAFIGKSPGRTNVKLFDRDNHIIRQFDVVVGYDLPGIRKALHNFLPHEHIGIELINTNIALIGEVSDATAADKAVKIVQQYIVQPSSSGGGTGATGGNSAGSANSVAPGGAQAGGAATVGSSGSGGSTGGGSGQSGPAPILNLLKVISGQQVMLRVRVGEIQRNAFKQLGLELAASTAAGNIFIGSNGGFESFVTGSGAALPSLLDPSNIASSGTILRSIITGGNNQLSLGLDALETHGLLKVLAEPNLVAISGEKAEFLAGGQFPIPTAQTTTGGNPTVTTSFQNFGVSVQFIPFVLSDNRIRMVVEPEVSQIDTALSTSANGITIPGLDTRRAKTTVELAPGESFMIAGLLSDSTNTSISQLPGASEIPILGALFRSTSFRRNETELVIAVTPYVVDPLKSTDVRLPTDDYRPPSIMEEFFYGALGSMSGNAYRISQTPSLEGPIGFMTD